MDLEDQWKILQLLKSHDRDSVVVLLGCPDAESSQIQTETVTCGDPSMVGPLWSFRGNLPVFHVIEDSTFSFIPKNFVEFHMGRYLKRLDGDSIRQRMEYVRSVLSRGHL